MLIPLAAALDRFYQLPNREAMAGLVLHGRCTPKQVRGICSVLGSHETYALTVLAEGVIHDLDIGSC